MATASHTITSLADIGPLVNSFAATAGWIVGGTTGEPTLTAPLIVGAIPFTLKRQLSATSDSLYWTDGTRQAHAVSPRTGISSSAPTITQPTKLWLFGGQTPQPYIHIAIEYGYNLYRHLYFGYAEKIGSYTGGEIICGSLWGAYNTLSTTQTQSYTGDTTRYLFSSHVSGTVATHGHMNINHADNPTQWRQFDRETNGALTLPTTCVMGGFRDAINDIYMARGVSPYAGANILVPVNLYAPVAGENMVPVGRPAGVRMVHIGDIEPATAISDGVKTWRVFPAARKNPATGISVSRDSWPPDETSYYVGYAFLED